jgi:hypothetical protein
MKHWNKIAAVLALFIGVMTVFAGSQVLLGWQEKDYTILNWLVIYNVVLGFISIVAAYLIWKKHRSSMQIAGTILIFHAIVLIYLFFFSEIVATESIKAMIFRVTIWLLINSIIFLKPVKK